MVKNQPDYDLPEDYGRLVMDTGWDRVESRPLSVMTPQQWQEWKSGLVKAEVWKQYRIKAVEGERKIFINPTPTTSSCTFECRDGTQVKLGLVVEYYSKNWAKAGGTFSDTISAGTDDIILPEDVVQAEFKWRWLRSLSRPYADEKFEAEQLLDTTLAQSAIPATISAHGRKRLPFPNIPETNVGLS